MAKKPRKNQKILAKLKKIQNYFLNFQFFFLIHSHISKEECLKISLRYLENQVLHIV